MGFGPHGFERWSSQSDDLKIYTCRFLARSSALLGYAKDWLAHFQYYVISDIRSRCWQPGLPVGSTINLPWVCIVITDMTLEAAKM